MGVPKEGEQKRHPWAVGVGKNGFRFFLFFFSALRKRGKGGQFGKRGGFPNPLGPFRKPIEAT